MLLVGGLALVALAATFGAASLRLTAAPAFLLAAYLIASAQIVGLTLLLSPMQWVSAAGYLLGELALLAVAAMIWTATGSPRPPLRWPDLRPAVRAHPLIALLAVVVAGAVAYELGLALSTPPNNADSLTYRLSRAAAWLQHGGLYWISDAHTERQNEFPANAEIQMLYTLVLAGRDVAVALPQLVAKLALIVAVAGMARRLEYPRAASLFAGLLFATLTEVALQSTSTQNDLITASYVAAGAYFVRSPRAVELALAGTALGLALGSKISAYFALPAVALIAAVSLPVRRLLVAAAAVGVGAALFGSYVVLRNLDHTGRMFGEGSEVAIYRADVTPAGTISTTARVAYRFIDFSGFRVRTRWLEPVADAGERVFKLLHIQPNPPESAGFPFTFQVNVRAHEDHSFFGPLGFLLVLPLSVAFTVGLALRRTTAARGVHALALPLFVLTLALAFRFSDEARYLVVAVALVLPLAAAVYCYRVLAWSATAVAILTIAFAHGYNELKPTGLGEARAVWRLSRAEATSLDVPTRAPLLSEVERLVPEDARAGVVLGPSDWDYPLYGRTFDRRLVALPHDRPLLAAERRGLRWVIGGRGLSPVRGGWRSRSFAEGSVSSR